jgi:mannose-6-phosphate isomerase-like protein (cupin superfamily)
MVVVEISPHGGHVGELAVSGEAMIEPFEVTAPLLERGVQDTPLFTTDELWGHLKVYAEGGENDLHAHPHEDHAFVVLQGEAMFWNRAGDQVAVRRYQGILVPRGAYYRFQNTGEGNLVMLRVGAGSNSHLSERRTERLGVDGRPMTFNPMQRASGTELPVESGEFFGGTG